MCILRVQEVAQKHKGLVHFYHVLKRFCASKLSWPRPRLKIVNIDQCPVYTRQKLGSSRLKVVHFLEKCYNSVLHILDLPRKIYKFVTEAKNKVTCFSLTIIKFFQSQTHRKELKSHLLLGAKSIYSASSFRACHVSINYSYPYSCDFVLCNFIGFESFEGLGACPTISHST